MQANPLSYGGIPTFKCLIFYLDEWGRRDLLLVHDDQFRMSCQLDRPDVVVRLVGKVTDHDQANTLRKFLKLSLPLQL